MGLSSKANNFIYVHQFSPYYDILLGRKVLLENNRIVDYTKKKLQ